MNDGKITAAKLTFRISDMIAALEREKDAMGDVPVMVKLTDACSPDADLLVLVAPTASFDAAVLIISKKPKVTA